MLARLEAECLRRSGLARLPEPDLSRYSVVASRHVPVRELFQGEYGRLSIDRYGADSTVDFDGFYVFGSVFLTGESRTIKSGVIDRLKPLKDFNPLTGDWGAIELAVRYDQLNLTDRGLSPLDRDANSWTAALNWYLNPNTKILFNYIRFKGENSPLVVAPAALNGTTAKGEAFATRLHFDF